MNVAHDSFLLVEEMVEERALSDVGVSDDGYRDAVLEGVAYLEGVCERDKTLVDVVGECV